MEARLVGALTFHELVTSSVPRQKVPRTNRCPIPGRRCGLDSLFHAEWNETGTSRTFALSSWGVRSETLH